MSEPSRSTRRRRPPARPAAADTGRPGEASRGTVRQLEVELEREQAARETAESLRSSTEAALVSERRRSREAIARAEKVETALELLRDDTLDQTSAIRQARGRAEAAEEDARRAGLAVRRLVLDVRTAILRDDAGCEFRLSITSRGRAIAAALGAPEIPELGHEPYAAAAADEEE